MPLKSPPNSEAAVALIGTVKWCLDLMIYLFDELRRLSTAVKGNEDNKTVVQAKSEILPMLNQ